MRTALNFSDLLPYWNVLLAGLVFTIVLTAASTVVGIALGTASAWCRTFGPRWAAGIARVYIELIRNTPFIVQLFFIFFGLPALGVKLTETTAAFLAMVINLGAYSAEIIRAGIQAVPKGHIEAGDSLAMSRFEVFRYIVLKQAFQKVYPALSSQIIIVMLGSSVVSQISAEDLTYAANFVQSRNFRAFEVYVVATLIYLLLAVVTRHILRGVGWLVFPRS
jgi:polar amino acid transport system permease protein